VLRIPGGTPIRRGARATDDIPAEWKSFRVDDTTGHHSVSTGNVGIGTASPTRRLDIRTAGGSDAEGIRLTHPAIPRTWDLVVGGPADTFAQDLAVLGFGDVVLPNADLGVGTDPLPDKALHVEGDVAFESNTRFGLIIGDPDITGGGGSAVRLGTRSDNGGPGVVQSIEDAGTDFGRLLLNPEGGRVGIGPFAYSDVFCTVRAHGGHPTLFAVYKPNNDQVFRVEDDGDIAGCGIACISDGRQKQAVEPLTTALDRVARLRPVSFEWRAELERDPDRRFGLIAQEVERVFPELVDTMNDGTRTVDYTALSAVLLGAVQEQQAEIERLREERDAAQASRDAVFESIEARLRRLEADAGTSGGP